MKSILLAIDNALCTFVTFAMIGLAALASMVVGLFPFGLLLLG